jgi:glutamate/tyrosine decarboxylase-like PLP-dependent enzyme
MGTTAVGSVDPLPEILELQREFGFRIHADAAYGGYFGLTDNLTPQTKRAFERLSQVDSIVIDPHKHGLQPYGCSCILFRDPSVGQFYIHDSPYTYFTSGDLHLGEISMECSRSGASAVALWATQRLLPLVKGGEFAKMLQSGRDAALDLYSRFEADSRFMTAFPPELDIVVWAVKANSVSEASTRARNLFNEAAKRDLHLALAELPVAFFDLQSAGMEHDRETITCLRSVLMKPEHKEWVGRIWGIFDDAVKHF